MDTNSEFVTSSVHDGFQQQQQYQFNPSSTPQVQQEQTAQTFQVNHNPVNQTSHFNRLGGGNLHRQHKSAMHLNRDKHTTFQNSEVSHICSYEKRDTLKTKAYRPMTSNAFRHPFNLGDPIGHTHYDSQFYAKPIQRAEPIRTGTSSGSRANKPHPLQEFMVFRFKPMKPVTNPCSEWSQPLGDKLLSQIITNQFKSTYATDFVNNVEEKAKFEERARQNMRPSTSGWKSVRNLEQTFEPMQYNQPFSYESLNISPNRYACNRFSTKPAVGIVPEVSRHWINYSGIN